MLLYFTENKMKKAKAGPGDMKAFQKEALAAHNKARDKHGVPHLKISEELNKHAQKWADHLASTNSFKHSDNHEMGENICMHYSSDKPDYSGEFLIHSKKKSTN